MKQSISLCGCDMGTLQFIIGDMYSSDVDTNAD